jgi:transcription antitermination factor NusG
LALSIDLSLIDRRSPMKLFTWRCPLLAMPHKSGRSLTGPRVEPIDGHAGVDKKAWFAVYTAPRHEKFVEAQLTAKQIRSFLPLYASVRRWKNGVRREIESPLLPGYVFVNIGDGERLPVLQTTGVVYLVGNGTTPSPLDDHEMHALRVGAQRAALTPRPFVSAGDVVCITRGPFRGVKGCVEQHGDDLSFVVTIQLIQRSFAIRVDIGDLELAG